MTARRGLPLVRSLSCAAILAGTCAASPSPDTRPLSVTIKPIASADHQVTDVDVSERLDGVTTDGKPLTFRIAQSAITVTHIADSVTDLSITDAAGPVPFKTIDDKNPSDGYAYRHWQLARAARYPLEIRYRMPIRNGPSRGGPPLDLARAGEGIAGSGYAFLMVPENLRARSTRITWDLSSMVPGSIGAFTGGAGDTIIDGPPRQMAGQWVIAGPAAVGGQPGGHGFHSYVLGDPPFDRTALATFGNNAYDLLTRRLTWAGRPDYRLMVRVRDGKAYTTGTAGLDHAGGAMVTTGTEYDAGQTYDDVRNTVFHEMTHFWVGDLADNTSWFSEGLTVYFTATLPCADKLLPPATCAASLNDFLRNYYTVAGRNWSQAKIEASGFAAEAVRRVPYARGALYFAELNSRIRARSHDRRSLIDAIAPLMAARSHGQPITVARFEAMVRRELGAAAVADFRAKVIEGSRPIEPASDAFGPDLERKPETFTNEKTGEVGRGFGWHPITG